MSSERDSESKNFCCESYDSGREKYLMEAIVSVDDRGQIVLPKDLRQKFGIEGGQKLAVVLLERGGVPCCLQLFKVESFSDSVRKIMDNR